MSRLSHLNILNIYQFGFSSGYELSRVHIVSLIDSISDNGSIYQPPIHGVECIAYIPMSIDTILERPISKEDARDARPRYTHMCHSVACISQKGERINRNKIIIFIYYFFFSGKK